MPARLNDALVRRRVNARFLTAVYVMLRPGPDGGVGGLVSLGGHAPALIRRADATVEEAGRSDLLLCTDGVTEAHGRSGHAVRGLTALSAVLATATA